MQVNNERTWRLDPQLRTEHSNANWTTSVISSELLQWQQASDRWHLKSHTGMKLNACLHLETQKHIYTATTTAATNERWTAIKQINVNNTVNTYIYIYIHCNVPNQPTLDANMCSVNKLAQNEQCHNHSIYRYTEFNWNNETKNI